MLEFTKKLIYDKTGYKIGIPIGNYTSQYFANIYLNELDQFVKHTLHIKYYVRYMDDFVILLKTKQECKNVLNTITKFLKNNLSLELNEKTRYYPYKMGVDFCGYRIYTTHRLLRRSSKKKILKKVRIWNKQWHDNRNLDCKKTIASVYSWRGHASHCNSYKLQEKVLDKCDFLYRPTPAYFDRLQRELNELIESEKKAEDFI